MDTPTITPAEQDAQHQHAVLALVLSTYPAHWAVEELVSGLTTDPDSFPERDPVERAIRDLTAAGLLHRHGNFVFATRAAVTASRLYDPAIDTN